MLIVPAIFVVLSCLCSICVVLAVVYDNTHVQHGVSQIKIDWDWLIYFQTVVKIKFYLDTILCIFRQDLAKFFWERGDEAIPSAIAASRIYASLGGEVAHYDSDLKDLYMTYKQWVPARPHLQVVEFSDYT